MKSIGQAASFITTRPVAILMVFLAAVVFGFLSLGRLPITLMPELTYPTLTVRTEYPGSAPEEVENDVSRPVEEALGVIAGLRKISSISRAGISDVVLEFGWNSDMSESTQSVLEKLDLVFLPEEARRPLILHYDPSLDPVMELSLSGSGQRFEGESGLRRLRRLAELQIKKELDPVKGVAAVRVRGGLEEEIHVLLEEEALRRTGISIRQVIDRLSQENINVAGGTLKEGRIEYLVRTLNEYENLDEISATIVSTIEGRDVRIEDLGRVVFSHKEREILTRTDGGNSVQIEIFKEGDANIVALARRVRALLGDFDPVAFETQPEEQAEDEDTVAAAMPAAPPRVPGIVNRVYREEGATLQLVADRSLFIASSINEVRNTAILGGMLAVFVLYLFLRNVKSTAIIAISIPISLLITFAPLQLLGVTLNIMSLGGLALGIGMLVDSSIVVLESIYRCREEGDDVVAAADRGTSEVRGAVLASTLTSIAVFFPMVFVEGLAGQAFGDLGLAVVVSLLAAAAVALFFIPMLASRQGRSLSGGGFRYFETEAWTGMRDGYRGSSIALRLVGWPLVALRFTIGFFTLYLRLAWRELREGIRAAPTWFKITNAHNWLVQFVFLVPPLSFVVRGVQRVEGAYLATLRQIWAETRADFLAIPLWARLLTFFPFWMLRFALILPLPHLLLPWPWPFLFASSSWAVVRNDYRSLPRWGRVVAVLTLVPVVFWIVRLLVGALFEGLGHLIIWAYRGSIHLTAYLIKPIIGRVSAVVSWIPLKLTGWVMGGVGRLYPRTLRSALAHPVVVVLIVVGCFWMTWQVVRGLESELLPEVYQGEFSVEVALPVGTPIEETAAVIEPIERAILAERDRIESLILTVGYDSANSQRSDEGEHTARFKILLDENSHGAAAEQAVIDRLRSRFAGIPDLETRVVRPVLFSSRTPIEVEVHGNDLRTLKEYGDRTRELMEGIPELTDVEVTLRSGAPEVQVIYDRDLLARYGLNVRQVAELVRDKVKGFEATRFNLKDRRIPILVRLALDDRESVDDVRGIIVNPGGERPIRLASVAEVTLGEGPSEVRRIDGRRVAVVRANIAEGSLSTATWKIEDQLNRKIEWPSAMTFFISGQNEEWERSRKSLWIALALSVFLVYVIMAAQFESLIHPLVIMLTIPLALVGTVVTLKVMGMALSIVVFLGMIMLAGIVVNNAIVLVDYINTLRRRGIERDAAIVQAGTVRLRPILMTTATTVLGLTPMALGLGDGAEIRTPMAIAVISGLISSTALTLVVIPSFYRIADILKQKILGAGQVTERGDAAVAAPDAKTVTP